MAKKVKPNPINDTSYLQPLEINPVSYGTDGSKYDQVSPIPLEEQRAAGQTGWDSFANITGRLVGRAALGTLEGIGMAAYGIPKALATRNINSLFDNELTEGFKKVDEVLLENTPFYQSQAEKNASLFSKEYLTSTPFWGNLIGEGGGFVLSALGSGMAIGKGLSSAGKLARNLGVISTDAEKIRELANAAKSGEKIFDKFNDLRSSITARNAAQYYTQRVAGNMYEAGVEARSVKEQILEAKMQEFREKNPYGGEPDDATKLEWENIANRYSNTAFGLNLALLLIDGMNMSRFLKGYKQTNKSVNLLRKGSQYAEKGTFGKILDRTLPVLGGGLAEAAQEGGQFITEKMTTDLGKKQSSMKSVMDFNDYLVSTIKGLEETFGSKEGQESMLAGFLLGAPFNIPSAINQGTVDKHGMATLANFSTDKVFPSLLKYNHKAYTDNVGNEKENYAGSNSHLLHEDLKRDDYYNYVKSRDNAGRFEDVLDDIKDLKSMDLNAFNEYAGEEYDEASRINVLNDLEKQARYYQKTRSEIEGAFSNHQNKEKLVEKSVLLNNLYERVKSLETKLASSNAPELIKTKWATDRDSLISKIAEEEMLLGEYLSQRKTEAEDILEEEEEDAKREIEEPSEIDLSGKELKRGEKIFYDGEEGYIENVEEVEDEEGNIRKRLTISTPSGQYKVFEDELDNDLDDEESNDDSEDDDYDSSEFKGVASADVLDANGKPIKWMAMDKEDPDSPFVNASDLGLHDLVKREKNISEDLRESEFHKSLKVLAEPAARVHDDIINNGDNYTYELEKEEDDDGKTQYNVYAKKGKTKTRVGYFLDFDEKFANNGKDSKLTISEFFDNYFAKETPESKSKVDIVKKITEAHQVLLSKEQTDITPNIRLATRINNTGTSTTLGKIMDSLDANRWKVNGEFVVATYSKGNYVLIGDVSEKNEKIFEEALQKPYNRNSIGAQFIVMVKRPTKTNQPVYNFINFKGAAVENSIKQSFIDRLQDPRIDKNALVKELNETFFITGSKGMTLTQGGVKTNIPVHLYFDTDSKGKVVIKREAKFVDGNKPENEIPKQFTKSKLDPIQILNKYAYQRITATQSRDLDYVKDNVVTNVDPKIWDSFFSFSHMSYSGITPKATTLSKANKSKGATNKSTTKDNEDVIRIFEKEVLNNKNFIKGLTEDGRIVEIGSGEDYDFYYNEKTNGPYKPGNPVLRRITTVAAPKIVNKKKGEIKSALTIGSKVDKIYRDFFDNNLGKAADYDIVSEKDVKQFSNLVRQLKELKSIFIKTGQQVYANNIVVYDDELEIAGTVDIVTIDKFGKIRIYDVKTMLGNQFETSYRNETERRQNGKTVSKYFSTMYGDSSHIKHSKQTSFYRMLLANTHGLIADELYIIPIEVSYKSGDTKTSRLNMLNKSLNYRHRLRVMDTIEGVDGLEYSINEDEVEEKVKENKKTSKPSSKKKKNAPPKNRKQQEDDKDEDDDDTEEETTEEIATAPASDFGVATTDDMFANTPDASTQSTFRRNDDVPFKPYSQFTPIEKQFIEKANEDIKRILNVDVRLEQNPYNFGSFRNKIIYLASEAPKGTLWHEGFHAIYSILSPDTKKYVIKTAEKVFNQPTRDEIVALDKIYRDRGYNQTFDYLYEKVLEEKVADLFQEYMNNKPTSFFGKIFEKLRQLVNYLIGATNDMAFQSLFDRIYGGEFKNIKPSSTDYSAKPIDTPTTSEREMLMLQLTAYWANRERYYEKEDANFNSFIKVMLNKIRKGHNAEIRNMINDRLSVLNSQLKSGTITKNIYDKNIKFIQDRNADMYVSEKIDGETIIYPRYLNRINDDEIIAEVKDYNQFKQIDEAYKDDDEDEKEQFYNEGEFEKSIHVTPAGKAVRAALTNMVIADEYYEIRPLNVKGIINNLSFSLSGLERKEVLKKLQSLAIKEDPADETNFSKSIKVILEEYINNPTFQRQFNTAFDRQFAKAGKIVDTINTRQSKSFLKIENGEDYISQQVREWEYDYSFNKKLDVIPTNTQMLIDSLGFNLQPETIKNEEAIKILNNLRKEVAAKLRNKDARSIFEDEISKDYIERLAEINVIYRDDLGELNFKNAEGKPQSSLINNSYIIKALNAANNKHLGNLKDKWKIYIGSKFGGKASDYKGIDPKAYFLSNIALYANENKGKSTPNFIIQQPSDKNTIYIVEGKMFTGKKPEEINNIYIEEKNRQLEQMDKIVQGIRDILNDDSIDDKKAFFVQDYDFVKGASLEDSLIAYERVNSGEISRNDPSVPRFLKFQNIPLINIQSVALDKLDEINYYQNLIDSVEVEYEQQFRKIMRTYMITDNDIKRLLNMRTVEEGVVDDYLKNFLINQNINRMLMLSEISPDLNQFKSFTDITKRAAGLLASGPSHFDLASPENNEFKFGIIPDRQKLFNSDVKNNDTAETLDGQGFETVKERLNRLVRLGRASKNLSTKNLKNDDLHIDYLILQAYIDDDRRTIEEYKKSNEWKGTSPLKVDKTVGYGNDFYMKTSIRPLTRYWSSDFAQPGQTITLSHTTKVFRGVDSEGNNIYEDVVYTETYQATQDADNGKYYLPRPGKEFEWNLMNEMQKNNMAAVFAKSAIKKGAKKVAQYAESDINNPVQNPAKMVFTSGANTFSYKDYRLQQENPSDKKYTIDGSQAIQQNDAHLPDDYIPEGSGKTMKQIRTNNENLINQVKEYQKNLYLQGFDSISIEGKKYCAFVNYIIDAMDSSGSTERIKEFFELDERGNFKFSASLPMIETKFESIVMSYFNNNIARHKVPGDKYTLTSSEFYRPMRDASGNILTTYEIEEQKKTNPNIYNELSSAEELRAPSKDPDGFKYAEVVVTEEYLEHLGITIQDWVRLKKSEDPEDKAVFEKISTFYGYRIPTQAHHSMLPCKIVDFMPTHFGSTIILPAEVTKLSGADYDVDSLFSQRYSIYKTSDGKIRMADSSAESVKKTLKDNSLIKEYLNEFYTEKRDRIEEQIFDLRQESKAKRIDFFFNENTQVTGKEMNELELKLRELQEQLETLNDDALNELMSVLNLDEAFNVNKVYNDMLDNRMQILISQEGRKLINTPAEDHFNNSKPNGLYGIIKQSENFKETVEDDAIYSSYSVFFNEWIKIFGGKTSIGGAANITKNHAFLQKNGAILSPDATEKLNKYYSHIFEIGDINEQDFNIAFDRESGQFYIVPGTSIRPKSDTLSNFVSMAVDNASNQTLIKYNIHDQNISELCVLASLGFGRNRIAMLALNPIIKNIGNRILIEDTLLTNKAPNKIKVISDYLKKFDWVPDVNVALTDNDLIEGLSDENYPLLEEMLELSEQQIREIEDPEIISLFIKQVNLARFYSEISNITKDYYTVNSVINYNKKVGSHGYDIDKVKTSIDVIVRDEKFSILGLENNAFISTVEKSLIEMRKKLQENVVSYTPYANDIVKPLINSTRKKGSDPTSQEFQDKMRKGFIHFLAMRFLRYKYEAGDDRFLPFSLTDKEIINGEKVISQFENVRNRIRKYPLGKLMDIIPPSDSYPFPRVGIKTYSNIDPENERILIGNFEDMLVDPDPEIRAFIKTVYHHIASHDNYKYISGSIVSKVRPKYHRGLNLAYKGAGAEIGLEDLFGMSDIKGEKRTMQEFRIALSELFEGEKGSEKRAYELVEEFGKFFFADGRNALFLKEKKKLFKDQNVRVKTDENKRILGYTVFLEENQDAPQFFKTIGFIKTALGNKAVNNIYVRKSIGTSNKTGLKIAEYVRVPLPRENKFTTYQYQLDFEDWAQLMNEGLELKKLLEKAGSNILEELRKIKTRKFNDDNLSRDSEEDLSEDENFALESDNAYEDENYNEDYEEEEEFIEDEEGNIPEEGNDENVPSSVIDENMPDILKRIINQNKTIIPFTQTTQPSSNVEITKFLDNDFENYLPAIQKIRGYKKIETKEDFLNLPQEKQESIIRKICKS